MKIYVPESGCGVGSVDSAAIGMERRVALGFAQTYSPALSRLQTGAPALVSKSALV